MNGVEQRHRLPRLVGLQRPDQVQLDARDAGPAAPAIWPWPPAPGSRRTPAGRRAITGSIASAPKVFDTATSVTDRPDRARPSRQASRDLAAHRRRAGLSIVSIGGRSRKCVIAQILAIAPKALSRLPAKVAPGGGDVRWTRPVNVPIARRSARKPILSIRARLVILALLAVVPLMLDRVRLLEASRAERIDDAATEVLELARRGADGQREIITTVRAMLQVMARAYVTHAGARRDLQFLPDGSRRQHAVDQRHVDRRRRTARINCSTVPTGDRPRHVGPAALPGGDARPAISSSATI